MEVLFLLLVLKATLAADRELIVFHADVDVFFVEPGNFQVQGQIVLVFVDVDCRHKACGHELIVAAASEVLEEAVHLALKTAELPEGLPASDVSHGSVLLRMKSWPLDGPQSLMRLSAQRNHKI